MEELASIFNQEKALMEAYLVIVKLRECLFPALIVITVIIKLNSSINIAIVALLPSSWSVVAGAAKSTEMWRCVSVYLSKKCQSV